MGFKGTNARQRADGWLCRARVRGAAATTLVVLGLGAIACSGGDDDDAGRRDEAPAEPTSTAERAPAGVVQVLMPEDVDLTLDEVSGTVGTETMSLTILRTGEVEEIGRGRATRQPAEGERFVVVELERRQFEPLNAVTNQEIAEMKLHGEATYSVRAGEEAPRVLNLDAPSYTPLPIDLDSPPQPPPAAADPAAPQRRIVVVSVAAEAEDVALVVTTTDFDQTLSLLTGEPGPDNVAVLARANRQLAGPVGPLDVFFTSPDFGVSNDEAQPISLVDGGLQWSEGSGATRRTAAPGRAILQVQLDGGVGFDVPLASELRLPDGTVVQPLPAQDVLSSLVPVAYFDVAADFTSGTLVFGKDHTWEMFGSTSSADFDAPVEYPFEIPLTI